MQNWKRAVVFGSLGVGAVLIATRRRPAGAVLAATGLALLASEYPEKFEQIRNDLPHYVDRGTKFLDMVTRMGSRFASLAEDRGLSMWEELSSYR